MLVLAVLFKSILHDRLILLQRSNLKVIFFFVFFYIQIYDEIFSQAFYKNNEIEKSLRPSWLAALHHIVKVVVLTRGNYLFSILFLVTRQRAALSFP